MLNQTKELVIKLYRAIVESSIVEKIMSVLFVIVNIAFAVTIYSAQPFTAIVLVVAGITVVCANMISMYNQSIWEKRHVQNC